MLTALNIDHIRMPGSCVAIGDQAVLLRGPSGSGKSDLALRLIDSGAVLIADDQVNIHRQGTSLIVSCPEEISGLLEVRGIGIYRFSCQKQAELSLVFDLTDSRIIERLPEPAFIRILDCVIPQFDLFPWDISSAIKVRLAVGAVSGVIMPIL